MRSLIIATSSVYVLTIRQTRTVTVNDDGDFGPGIELVTSQKNGLGSPERWLGLSFGYSPDEISELFEASISRWLARHNGERVNTQPLQAVIASLKGEDWSQVG